MPRMIGTVVAGAVRKPTERTNQTQRESDPNGGCRDVSSSATRLLATQGSENGRTETLIPVRSSRGANGADQQQKREGSQRQQGSRDEPEARVIVERLHHYPFSSSAVSTSTVTWLL